MNNKAQIIERFHAVKQLGYIPSRRRNNTGIGKTFEDYIGVVENNLDAPDLFGFEIKTHREEADSYITLFTKSPEFPRRANALLLNNYGIPYEDNPHLKRLHTSIFAHRFNNFNGRYSFRMINDSATRTLKIGVYDIDSHELLYNDAGYNYDTLQNILHRKLNNLFYVDALRRFEGEEEQFYFHHAEIYTTPSLERFLQLLNDGWIMYDIRIGSYQSGRNIGRPHDHGSGFRILKSHLPHLYEEHEVIE